MFYQEQDSIIDNLSSPILKPFRFLWLNLWAQYVYVKIYPAAEMVSAWM